MLEKTTKSYVMMGTCRACGREYQKETRSQSYCSEECKTEEMVCQNCGKTFRALRVYTKRGQYKFCSDQCRKENRLDGFTREMLTGTCETCGKEFSFRPSTIKRGVRRRHCSKKCSHRKMKVSCIVCGTVFQQKVKTQKFCCISCYRKHGGETNIETIVRVSLEQAGIDFEQERRIRRWSVDFLVEGRVVVEVDGDYWHNIPKIAERDAKRDAAMAKMGLTVIRLSEHRVRTEPNCVIKELQACGLGRHVILPIQLDLLL